MKYMFAKNQMVRFRIIDCCLRKPIKKYWSKQELITEFYKADIIVNERTLDYDIEKMRSNDQLKYYAPIKYSKYNNGYYYEDPDYSIENLPLNEKDIQSLEFAAAILNQYKDIHIFNEFKGTVEKLVNLVNHIKHEPPQNIIAFERSSVSPGSGHLDLLLSLIKEKRVIQTEYKRFEGPSKQFTISPYLLKEYRNRWYLLGYNHVTKNIITLGLDRIVKITPRFDSEFQVSPIFNPDSYFKHTIGITFMDAPVEEIILSFDPYQGHYLRTQPLHCTQEILEDDEDEFRIKLTVVPNYELYSTILSYGPYVEVISPSSIKEIVIGMLQVSIANYK